MAEPEEPNVYRDLARAKRDLAAATTVMTDARTALDASTTRIVELEAQLEDAYKSIRIMAGALVDRDDRINRLELEARG